MVSKIKSVNQPNLFDVVMVFIHLHILFEPEFGSVTSLLAPILSRSCKFEFSVLMICASCMISNSPSLRLAPGRTRSLRTA